MSFDVSIYFNAKESFVEVVSAIERAFHLKLTDDQDADFGLRYGCEVFDLLITVWENHGMIDEPELGFLYSDYKHAISVTIFVKADADRSFVKAIALFMAQRLFMWFGWPSIVVAEGYKKLLDLA